MFFRKITTRSNGKEYTYVKLIENYRKGNKIKQRVIANLGNIEELDPDRVRALMTSLAKVCGVEPSGKPKLKIKRVLRYGDALLIHKIWERLGLTGAAGAFPGMAPDLALTVELLVIAELLRLPAEAVKEWRRHLYLPASEQANPPPREEALSFLAENGQRLQEHIFSRLQDWGKITSPIYLFAVKSLLENIPAQPAHFLSRRGERRFYDLDLFMTPAGIPAGYAAAARNTAGGQNLAKRTAQAGERFKDYRVILVGNLPAHPEENPPMSIREYITGLSLAAAQAGRSGREVSPAHLFPPDLFSADLLENFHRFADDLWYRESKAEQRRCLVCANPFQNRRFVIQTNIEDLPASEIIRIYNDFAAVQARYRVIECPDQPVSAAGSLPGQIFISWLTHLVERLLDYIFQEQGMNINAAAALQILEPVKIVINEMGGEIGSSVIAMDKAQKKILSALEAGAAPPEAPDQFHPLPVPPGDTLENRGCGLE
ncbi:MAG: hypothetical protein AB1556_10605 [Bacillota bacterium]